MFDSNDGAAVARMLGAKRVAVVGLSPDPYKPSYGVAAYLMDQGVEIIPVNPNYQEVLGRKCYKSLKQVPGPIDVVNVFRRPEHCADVVKEAIEVGAKGVWLQSGIRSADGKRMARDAEVDYVEDKCIKVEHAMRRGA